MQRKMIEKYAIKQAATIFVNTAYMSGNHLTAEDIERIAQTGAEVFYQSGKVFLFLKASKLGRKEDVEMLYKDAMIDALTQQNELHGSESFEKDRHTIIRELGLPKNDVDEAQ